MPAASSKIVRRSSVDACKQSVDAALLDDAIGIGAGAGAEKQILDVLEPARLAVDQVFAFAVAVDAAARFALRRLAVCRAPVALSNVSVTSARPRLRRDRRAVEDDVGHLAAAQALGRLLAEDPLDGVDDVALAAAVGPDDRGQPRRKLEHRLVGEALEADKFEPLEHIEIPALAATRSLRNGAHSSPKTPGRG